MVNISATNLNIDKQFVKDKLAASVAKWLRHLTPVYEASGLNPYWEGGVGEKEDHIVGQ